MKKIKILVTLGPSTLDKEKLKQLEKEGVDLSRINLSHTSLSELESIIRFVQSHTSIPICIDSEGAQLRTGRLNGEELVLQENEMISLGEAGDLRFNFNAALNELEPGDCIHIDFDSATIRAVEKKSGGTWNALVISGGKIGSNRAAHVDQKELPLPPITPKDEAAISIAKKNGVNHFALSFANSAEDIARMRQHIGRASFLISKIESNGGLKNLNDICIHSDAILIDRGDLSRAQPLEKIPFLQKQIIATAKTLRREVYVATNLLESMTQNREPTRAEVCDVAGALLEGADGLVLAAETAIGKHPISCVKMMKRIIKECQFYWSKKA